MSSAWRARSKMTAVRSRTGWPSASASAWRFSVGHFLMSTAPRPLGPTAIFSM